VAFVWNSARAQVLCGQGYRAEIWNPCPGVLITRLRGFGSVECCRFYTDRAELEMHIGPLVVFHDWQEVQRYAPEARNHLKQWARIHNDAFGVCHYLIRSKILTMVIAVASLALGRDLIATSERAKFEAALQRSLAARQR